MSSFYASVYRHILGVFAGVGISLGILHSGDWKPETVEVRDENGVIRVRLGEMEGGQTYGISIHDGKGRPLLRMLSGAAFGGALQIRDAEGKLRAGIGYATKDDASTVYVKNGGMERDSAGCIMGCAGTGEVTVSLYHDKKDGAVMLSTDKNKPRGLLIFENETNPRVGLLEKDGKAGLAIWDKSGSPLVRLQHVSGSNKGLLTLKNSK